MQSFIFDFNGTLYPDKELHRLAWKRFLTERGIGFSDEEYEKYMYGPANDVIVRRYLGNSLPLREVRRLSAIKEAMYREIALEDTRLQVLTPGTEEMLETLSSRGIPHAIATASMPDNADFYFNTLGIGRWFDRRHVFFHEADLPGKPDPAIYRLAMHQLGYKPNEVTVVEDSMSGIQSAIGADIKSIIAIDTTMGPNAFEGISAVKAVIHDFYDFERFIEA